MRDPLRLTMYVLLIGTGLFFIFGAITDSDLIQSTRWVKYRIVPKESLSRIGNRILSGAFGFIFLAIGLAGLFYVLF